jgi:TonB family protein
MRMLLPKVSACATLLMLAVLTAAQVNAPRTVRMNELTLRRKAMNVIAPKFPAEAVKKRATGVAVVDLLVGEDGDVAELKVLEAPHPLIQQELEQAIRQWHFETTVVEGRRVRARGKLTFYFVINHGKAAVENPLRVESFLKEIGRSND